MSILLVRDVMTIGVPICAADERCDVANARLAGLPGQPEVAVVLDEDGMAAGWVSRARLDQAEPASTIGSVMDEDIPELPPDIPAQAALQMMRDRGQTHVFLMHSWPGEPRPSAVLALSTLERLELGGI